MAAAMNSYMETKKNKNEQYVPRILQADAANFNTSITELVNEQLLSVQHYLKPGLLDSIKPEIKLAVEFLLLKGSLLKLNGRQTFGQQLFGLQYHTILTKNQVYGYVIANCLLPYIANRSDKSLNANSKIRLLIKKLTKCISIIELINFIIFLRKGVYPTLSDRLFGLKHIPIGTLNRNMGYNFLARELLWHGFMEFCMFILPLINVSKLKRIAYNLIHSKKQPNSQIPNVSLSEQTTCCVCHKRPTTPCRVSLYCIHLACYYCIQANVLADEKYACPYCGVQNTVSKSLQYC